jgi:hypothetical protein
MPGVPESDEADAGAGEGQDAGNTVNGGPDAG